MADLKPGWRRVKFGEVVRQVKEKVDPATSGLERYVAGEHMGTDDLRIRRWGEIEAGYLGPAFHMHFKPGQVLYGSRRTYLRKVAVPDFEGICANTTFVLESADPSRLLPEFLPFVMQTDAFHEHSKRESKGSVNPYVNFSDLAWYEFALPPLEEQRRVVDVLSTLREADEAHKALCANARQLARAYSESTLSTFFDRWARKPLPALCEVVTVGIVVTPAKYYVPAGGVPVLRSLNVWPGRFVLDDLKRISAEGNAIHAKSALRSGDVVLVRTGDPGRPGNAAVVPPEMDGWNCVDVVIARPTKEVLPSYLASFINAERSSRLMQGLAPGTKQKHLSVQKLDRFEVPVPPPSVQQWFVGRHEELAKAVHGVAHRSEMVRRLAQSALAEFADGASP